MTYNLNVVGTATYVAGFRGSAASYIVVGDTSLGGESGINLRNSTGQTFITQSGNIFDIATFTGINVIRFQTGGTEAARITATNRNFHIGTFTADSGEKLQVTGTAKITDSATFSKAYSNTSDLGVIVSASIPGINLRTVSTGRTSFIQSYNSNGTSSILVGTGSNNPTTTVMTFNGNDGTVNVGSWEASTGELLQVNGTAKIRSKLSMGAGTTSNAQINLASSTAPTSPNNGDIWFDGTDLKMRIGGVTKTFTLI
jgi:hypothetical protein